MTRRIKTVVPSIQSKAEAEQLLGEIRALVIEQTEVKLEMERAIAEIQESHSKHLSRIEACLTAMVEQMEVWADSNRAEFGDRKSLDLTHGQIGWRTSTPSLALVKKMTWKGVLDRLREMGSRRFIRTKQEVAKDLILAHRRRLAAKGLLEKMGVKVEQKEVFFAEPTVPQTEARQEVEG
jgi:phage host-nuclease inhibitor protein Gam